MGQRKHSEESKPGTVAAEREQIIAARGKGRLATLGVYTRLAGPGWLQSAITLGGGSLAGSLYLGVLGGTHLLWLQPLAMMMGVIMLSAIAYVTLSTGERPFRAINRHVSPVLGWGWALATLMANCVWALPQFSLGTAALRQNLLPGLSGEEVAAGAGRDFGVSLCLLAVATVVIWLYGSGTRGIRIFEGILRVMVGIVIVAFLGVVLKLSFMSGAINWTEVGKGFLPRLSLLRAPAPTFAPFIEDVLPAFQSYWTDLIVGDQRKVMITAAATAVGINMTFLLPYSMLRKGWDRHFRGLAAFDLATGLFVPFLLVTTCIVIASSTQFHTQPYPGLPPAADQGDATVAVPPGAEGQYRAMLAGRVQKELGTEAFAALSEDVLARHIQALPLPDKQMAAMLVKRDAFDLAHALKPLTGEVFGSYVFGIGVLGMAVSTIIILMLINGFTVCEMLGVESEGWIHRVGCLIPGIGVLGPLVWGDVKFWAAVPTSVFGMALLPIAYFSFYFLMNQPRLLGSEMPRGTRRVAWNLLMALAAGLASVGALFSIWSGLRVTGLVLVAAFVGLALLVQWIRQREA